MNAASRLRPWPSLRTWVLTAVLASAAGCGLKGPLYVPDEKPDMIEVKKPGLPLPSSPKKERASSDAPGKQPGASTRPPEGTPEQ